MAFVNRIRLPFKITRPQFQEERDVFRKANGEIKVLSAVIRKRYEGETDHWPEKLHERFKIALSHDNVSIEGEKYIGGVVQDGEYTINWPDFLDYPLGKAQFFVFATPFDASNSNCGGCEDFIQVVAEDDVVPGNTLENFLISWDVLANDSICCEPVQLFIVSTNSTYVQSASVNPGNAGISITTKSSFPSGTNVVLATYRVQCENGQYDEANIIAENVVGSEEPPCQSPTDISVTSLNTTGVTIEWTAPTPAPDSYIFELHELDNLGVPVSTGETPDAFISIGELTPGTAYRFYIRSNCGDTQSDWQYIDFVTQEEDAPIICGRYRLTPTRFAIESFNYVDCNGEQQIGNLVGNAKEICMLQNSPGDPVLFNGSQYITITYLGPC